MIIETANGFRFDDPASGFCSVQRLTAFDALERRKLIDIAIIALSFTARQALQPQLRKWIATFRMIPVAKEVSLRIVTMRRFQRLALGKAPLPFSKAALRQSRNQISIHFFFEILMLLSLKEVFNAIRCQKVPLLTDYVSSIVKSSTLIETSPYGLSEDCRVSSITTAGNMMELEHVPKARLLVRHPPDRVRSTPSESIDLSTIRQNGYHGMQFNDRNARSFMNASSGNVEIARVLSYPCPNPPVCLPRWSCGIHESEMSQRRSFDDGYRFYPSSTFDVSRLASLKYQNIGDGSPFLRLPPQCTSDPFGYRPLQPFAQCPRQSEPSLSHPSRGSINHSTCPPLQNKMFSTDRWTTPVDGNCMAQPYSLMIPTPQFMNGAIKKAGSIEFVSDVISKSEAASSTSSHNARTQTHDSELGRLDDPTLFDFMDELLYPETPKVEDKFLTPLKSKFRFDSIGRFFACRAR